ncbi:MAG: zinc ribbon domain-containing protein [Okeania sp. SIO2G4]|uniref:zinc ribbon domain-containing protein n=1 Tax=unclassified Okeania TaxID=2634635 RepID=UPI0013BB6DC9|nr:MULTISPECIES: zinc ribbon domain-containing protein [unclassified Okeania]NEP08284.1 zinc ribbon domain-containing protein [Okeania sp. SIO4D6]NEP42252.1 zinc ribbon domain-containing protein [Okeania sp. SIO2H7]NEP72964.1 zinc ribbon domain-containing protein [Okeania sp. SIO2G5]NEP94962.1 zinc ribbon domain-containing protein [Okeania sp. SIO2F5]NEQ92326.1 zinc ribbon domain-containing protein [Okeania sp. SIO2G4]
MPVYDYFCSTNQQKLEVWHSINENITTWGQLCKLAKCDLGDTPEDTPVKRMISAPRIIVETGISDLKSQGFSKLVKRDQGIYENITATGDESRIVNINDHSTYPNFKQKLGD